MNVKFVIVSVVLICLIIIFLRKWIVRFIILSYISIKYGKYSHEFFSYFKDNNLISPYNSCVKDQITTHFLVFTKKIKNSDEFQTTTSIDYEEIPFLESSENLIHRKGNPDCINVATLREIKFMVIGYNEYIHDLKMKSMYFFLNDHFVMGEFLFSDIKRTEPNNLIEMISSKYLNGNPIGKDFFYVKDTEGNQLNFENNGFSIAIKYLFRGDPTTNMILSESNLQGSNLTEKNLMVLRNEELLDRL